MRDVHITVRPDLGSTVDKPSECVGSSAKAVLGDTHNQGVDRDDFQFAGEGGERVTIRLLPDGSSGHLGTTASLMLRGPSGKTIASQNGAPALELQTTLPEAGTYEIRVAEPGDPDEDSYRGHYVLQLSREDASSSVPSTGRNVLSLKPKRNVEY